MSDTPRTDEAKWETAPAAIVVSIYFAQTLERELAALRNVLSRLVEVHDAMGGVCGTVRIAAEEALLGKAQSEYICTCGIRVTPHKCPTNNGF